MERILRNALHSKRRERLSIETTHKAAEGTSLELCCPNYDGPAMICQLSQFSAPIV
jgi:hypothetical protein